ncbi:protein split ends isoform X5 [Chironomus tepperi]|uniref:protein split ends isoform X5 n=1 Tax=Chironomus tepperi TaxID=113505 RepID=UPI00391FB5DC
MNNYQNKEKVKKKETFVKKIHLKLRVSSDDHSPGYERTNFYDRVSTSQSGNRNTETSTTDFIRRNSYHSNDIRGRQRDRHFRNSPYSLIVDRSNQISHHRLTSNTWYETSPSSSSSRSHYSQTNLSNSNNTVFQQPDSSYDRHSDLSDHQTSSPSAVTTSNSNINNLKDSKILSTQTQALITNTESPYKSKLLVNNHHHHHKSIKSRSGSESPISNRSSRSHSRSPSSCSSTHSSSPTSSRDSNSSPISISANTGDLITHNTPSAHHHSHHRHLKTSSSKSLSGSSHHSQRHRRNLQASLSNVPLQNSIDKPASSTSSLSSSGSLSGSNSLGFYSEDNRPLAICVRNLPLRSSDTSLKDGLFHEYKKHGKVTWVKVVGQNHDRYALVCFKKPEDVDKALEVSQDKLFFGCKIEVQPYQGYDVDDNEFRPYEAELDEYQPKSTRTLFIGNLEKDITVAELRKHFECFGEILEIDIKKQGSSPYAFCQYADIVSVVKAVRKMDGEHLGSTRIKLGFGKSMPTTCVWFDGIADSVTDHYLSQQCSRYGTVQKVTIDRERRMALVTFDQIQSAQQAVKEMRGIPMRGRKLQVDFASRECIDAFYARLEKHGTATNSSNYEMSSTPGTNCNNRYLTNLSRSRASSFSRPGNPMSGTASPTSTPSAGSTPRHLSAGSVPRKFRYATGSPEFYDSTEYLDTYGNYDHDRGVDSDHMTTNDGEATSLSRRRCDKSPVERPRGESEGPGVVSSVMRRRCDRSPGEMRILESQRHKILDQLEKCPSSGDEAESPKKRAKYSQEVEDQHHHHNNHHDSSTTNCNGKVLDHREHSSYNSTYNHHRYYHNELAHRKTVEIRRLSDCNIKHTASVPGGAMTSTFTKTSRRPSTDSLSRYSNTQVENYQLHKRRKTSAGASTSSSSSSMTANEMEIKSRIHPIQSFETSGGESEHGSRPDTPLFDEKPDNAPTDPRQNRPRISREPLNLPLPKFAQGFHQQLRQTNQLLPSSHAIMNVEKYENCTLTSAFAHHSSLTHKSISPSPQHHPERSRSNSIMPPISSGSSISETLLTSPRPPSLTSNSSDSEQELSTIGVGGLSTSPSLEERLKKLSEDYDSWSSNGRSSSSSHYMNNLKHSVPEIPIPETPELLKNVLKNSMFDEDMKRLENINTQAPTSTSINVKNNFGSFNSNHLSLTGTQSPLMSMSPICSISTVSAAVMHSESLLSGSTLGKLHMPVQQPVITTVIQHRLGSSSTGSPMNSPNAASPYNSPNPSSASSISSLKGLQYPFPSHTTTTTCNTVVSNNSSTNSIVSTCSTSTTVSSVTSIIPSTSTVSTTAAVSSQQKPKTCTLSKSVSLQESPSATTGTNNNHSNNNFNASFNKSSTNNLNNNSSNDNPTTSKQLVKSISLPSCGSSAVETENINNDEKKVDVHETGHKNPNDDIKKEHEIVEKRNHVKDRRKNSEHDEIHAVKDDVKEHLKKEKEICKKEKEGKKSREKEFVEEKKIKSEAAVLKTISKKTKADDSCSEDKKEEIFERAPSPALLQRKSRRASTDDMSGVDSSVETLNHMDNNKSQDKKDGKHHEANRNNSKHHHHVHKERKNSIKDKLHNNDEELHAKTAKQNDLNSSKDSIFDELKRNTKDNIIKTNDKVHKNKKHHHHHRDNGNKDKENQTHQVHHYNDISSAIITDDVINRSSEDDSISLKHNHNGKKQDFSEHEHEITANHKKHDDHHTKSSEENHSKKKYPRRNLNISISTDDTEDSDGNNKKTSFFDILDDGPNISMYDKVKARSCKNLKKQEEEKKIKDKFTALKQSRAKREKKRLNTSEDDSDSDMHDTNSNDMFLSKFKKSHLSATDDEMRESDDEVIMKKIHKSRNQFSNICDDESSESGINIHDGLRKKTKFNRKISRIVIDSSEDEMPAMNNSIEIKEEPNDSFDELKKQDEDISDMSKNYNKHSSKKRHHDKVNKDDKANKKSKKISKEHHRKSTSSTDSMQKREDDIFGSVSEEDHPISSIVKPEIKNDLQVVLTDIKKEKIDELIGSDTLEVLTPKERQRDESKKRKEKRERRREREKQRIIKEEENSVDLDEAGRALEAQLMSDSDHKINNNEITKELKSEDVFHFTDDDIKHHDSSKKKKKKKRTKEERKHHHNHHHYDNIKQEPIDTNMESVSPFNNNNNTKMKLDVVCEDVIKPSVPSLIIDEISNVETKPQPQPQLLSPVSQLKKESKPKPEMSIPGFGGVPIDETVHEKAVMSIAAELEKNPIVIKEEVPTIPSEATTSVHEKKLSKTESEKPEEKSRVIISQEETEDAVAALLGESFSMTHEDYNDPYDVPIVSAEDDIPESIEDLAIIPPEEDEEMKKAIMSLNSEIERKTDTPQSEHDLQIDTDTEDPVEEENSSNPQLSFDEPPKTPDVEVAPTEKEKLDISDSSEKSLKIDEEPPKEVPQVNEALKSIKEPEKEVAPKVVEKVIEEVKKEVKVEEKVEKVTKPTTSHRHEPPSITIPTEQQLSLLNDKSSPRKHQSSPTKSLNPLYSPITPATGKDPQINIFSMNATSTPSIIPPSVSAPKIIGIPTKPTENKTILIHTSNVQTPPTVQQNSPKSNNAPSTPVVAPVVENKEPAPQPPTIQVIPKFTQVVPPEIKVEAKPVLPVIQKQVPQPNAIRQPQIIYPPTTINSVHHVQPKTVQPEVPVEPKDKVNQWQPEPNSVIHKVEDNKQEDEVSVQQEKVVEKPLEKKEALSEASHEDDETEGSSLDNSMEKENPNFKKNRGGGKQRGRKGTVAQSPPQVQQPIQEEVPSSPQTRRGGKTATAAKRGRGGKTTNTKNIVFAPQQSLPLSPPATGTRQQKISESDVYEFHDDSGEELVKTGDQRPRLIMTIKSTAAATSTVTQPVTTQSTIIQSTSSVTPIVSTVTTSTVAVSNIPAPQPTVIEPPQELLVPPSPSQPQISSPAHHTDEFVQPGNTRKSKRLLEKDGPRTSVDDTIDDVIRNSMPAILSNMANARTNRVTRQNPVPQVNVVQSNIALNPQPVTQAPVPIPIETKKQTRTNKKQKDRKASETSESETEKKDEKQNVVHTTIQQPIPPIEAEIKPILAKAPIQPEPPKIIQIPTPISVTKPHMEMLPPKKEGTELLQLIDPVTGELQKMTQSKEGQYVPVSDNRTAISQQPPTQTVVVTQSAPIIVSQPAPAIVQPVYHIEQTKLQHQNHIIQQQQQNHPMPQNHPIQQQMQNHSVLQQQQQSHSVLQQQQQSHSALQQQQQQQQQQQSHPMPQDDKKIIPPTMSHNVIKVSSPVVIEPPKSSIITEPSHVIKPVITQNPQAAACKPLKNYIYNTQPIGKPPVSVVNTSMPNTPTTVISSQNIVKMNVPTGNVQQPSTIYSLGNIIPPNVSSTKYVTQPPTQIQQQQKTIVMQPHSQTTIIHPVPPHTTVSGMSQPQAKPQIIHQKIPSTTSQPQIVIHPQSHQMPLITGQQHGAGNLMINIPNSTSGSPSIPSPSRMTVKQVIQRTVTQMPQQQVPPQNIPPSATVVVKTTQQPVQQTHTVISSQDGPKLSQPAARTTYIPPGTKIVDAPVVGYNNREVIFVDSKHKMFPNYQTKYAANQQPLPSPTQSKPPQQIVQQIPSHIQQGQMPQQSQQSKIIEKISSQPQVSVQHISMPITHPQKVYITNSGQVISNIPISSQPHEVVPNDRQQWVAHEKAAQPLKRYVMDYEDHQRVQQQHQSQQQPQQMAQASPIPRKQTYVIETPSGHPPQPVHHAPTIINHQSKTIIGLNQSPQILTGAVASPPLKAHIGSQQPIVTGASSSRIAIPTVSPKDQHIPQRHYPPEVFEDSVMHGDRSAYRSQSPPPAHQTSPLTTRPPYLMTKLYQPPSIYMRGSEYGRLTIPRMGMPGTTEQRELPEIEEPRVASPPLELRRTTSMPLQSPSDRITDSPMMAPLYLSPRIPQPYFYEGEAIKPLPNTEPPPAHRPHPTSTTVYATQQQTIQPNLTHVQRDREHREKDEAVKIVYSPQGPPTQSLVAPVTNPRPIQLATPPIASQVPPHADTLSRLLERYPLMWQGLLALKTEQAAVQMHFVHGNKKIAKASLPINADHTTPPLRIAQRMRLEPSQIDGVARKMTIEDEHCVLLALPCGFDYSDVLRQTENLQVSFINYLQLKQAAGIINIADPGSQNASYVVHIFPSCDFANDSLQRIAPDLMFKVANIAYLLIVIATV